MFCFKKLNVISDEICYLEFGRVRWIAGEIVVYSVCVCVRTILLKTVLRSNRIYKQEHEGKDTSSFIEKRKMYVYICDMKLQ